MSLSSASSSRQQEHEQEQKQEQEQEQNYYLLPPVLEELEASFSAPHTSISKKGAGKGKWGSTQRGSGSVLTVGARALAKHCHRDASLCWWGGPLSGGEAAKNETAAAKLRELLRDPGPAWVNLHCVASTAAASAAASAAAGSTAATTIQLLEVRNHLGYGARWELPPQPPQPPQPVVGGGDGRPPIIFRGFLEPNMPDGHEKGWRH